MKNMKKLLSAVGLFSIVGATTLSVVACGTNETTPRQVKFINLEKSGHFYSMSSTTSILQDNENDAFFFDITKVNQENKGFINLDHSVTAFYAMSSTVGILRDNENNAFFFDSTKIAEEGNGFVELGKTITAFYAMSSTVAILLDNENNTFFFDSTKIANEDNEFIDLNIKGNFNRMSDTTGIFRNNEEITFFDSTKINEANKGFIILPKKAEKLIILSNTKAILEQRRILYLFDSTQVNSESKGIVGEYTLAAAVGDGYRLSSTAGIITNASASNTYFLNISEKTNEIKSVTLEITINQFNRISNNTAIFKEYKTDEGFLFDATKVNEESKGLIKLNKSLKDFYVMSNESGIFTDNKGNAFFFEYK